MEPSLRPTYAQEVPDPHQFATSWPLIFGLLAVIANVVIAIAIRRDPKAQVPLTLTAVALTVLSASMLFPSPRSLRNRGRVEPNTVFYPSVAPPAQAIPAGLQYRRL
jgi:hypothetical protein